MVKIDKSKWHKDLIRDELREADMDEQRLGKMPLHLFLALNRLKEKDEKCQCAYCKEGMSESASECVDRMVEVSKRLREHLNKLYNTTREEKNGLKGKNKS